MPLDPGVRALLEAMAKAGLPKIGSIPASQMRQVYTAVQASRPKGPEIHRVEERSIPAQPAPIPARLYLPSDHPSALVVYFHGGGWTIGNVDMVDVAVRKLALEANCAIISVDYRLAPEHRFPAAVDDAVTAVRWVGANVAQLVGASVPLFVAGDSAGGNLAAVVSQIVRDEGGPAIAGQILIYPSTDGDIEAESLRRFESPFLTLAETAWFFDQYIPDRQLRVDRRFAPLRSADLTRLPPAFVLTAEYDILCEQAEAYARRLADAGIPVKAERYLGTIHGFFSMDGGLEHSLKATKDIAAFIADMVSGRAG